MLIDQIKKDIIVAAKDHDDVRRDILRLLKGTLDQSGSNPSDDDVLAAIKKIVKSNLLTIESMEKTCDRASWTKEWIDNDKKLSNENLILTSYLPAELDEAAIKLALSSMDFSTMRNSGQAVGTAMKFFKSKSLPVSPILVKMVVESMMGIGDK